jgi:hypothetical protein
MKDPRPEDIKELTINGVLYAKYHMDGDVLFFKHIKNIIPDNDKDSEDCATSIIGLIEQREFTSLAFLNI